MCLKKVSMFDFWNFSENQKVGIVCIYVVVYAFAVDAAASTTSSYIVIHL